MSNELSSGRGNSSKSGSSRGRTSPVANQKTAPRVVYYDLSVDNSNKMFIESSSDADESFISGGGSTPPMSNNQTSVYYEVGLDINETFDDNDDNNHHSSRENLGIESFKFPSGLDPRKLNFIGEEELRVRRIKKLRKYVQTVNNLSRLYEALAFLDDDKISLEEKQVAVMTQNSHGVTALMWAVRRNADIELIRKMVEIGGMELLLIYNKSKENVLHQAAFLGCSYAVFGLMVATGEKDILMQQDRMGNVPLHYACAWGADEKTIHRMARMGGKDVLMMENEKKQVPHSDIKTIQDYLSKIGGKEYEKKVEEQKKFEMSFFSLVMLNKTEEAELMLDREDQQRDIFIQNENGLTALMVAIWFLGNTSHMYQNRLISLIRKMVEVGGEKLVEMKNNTNGNAIHYATFNNAPLEIIHLLVDKAGLDALEVQNNWGNTPCHDACYRQSPVSVIEYLVKKGGSSTMSVKNNNEKTPIEMLYDADIQSDEHILALQQAWYELDPNFSVDCSTKVLYKTLQWADGVDRKFVTSNPFLKSILNERFVWTRYQMFLFADFYAQFAVVLFLLPSWLSSIYSDFEFGNNTEGNARITITIWGLAISIAWFIFRELIQLYSSTIKQYARGIGNYMDAAQIILLVMAVQVLNDINDGNGGDVSAYYSRTERRVVFILSSLFSWLLLLRVFSRLFYDVSVFVYAVTQIFLKLAPFLLTAAIIVMAFAQVFFIAGVGTNVCVEDSAEWQCSVESSYFQAFGMLTTADFDNLPIVPEKESDGELIYIQQIISMLFSLTVGILLLNILIAVVNNVFTQVSEDSDDAFWTTRMAYMVEVNEIMTTLRCGKDKLDSHHDHTSSVRKVFAEYDDKWMEQKCSEKAQEDFYDWWYYDWSEEVPPLKTRLWYFCNEASFQEIVYPSKVIQNILFGLKYNEEIKGFSFVIALIFSIIYLVLSMVTVVILFFTGLVSFGYFWPYPIKKILFFGPVETRKKSSTAADMTSPAGIEKSKFDMLEQQMVYLKQGLATLSDQISDIQERLNARHARPGAKH